MANASEVQALTSNDIRVLVSELNARIKEAAEQGLHVRLNVANELNVTRRACSYPVVSVELFTEVK